MRRVYQDTSKALDAAVAIDTRRRRAKTKKPSPESSNSRRKKPLHSLSGWSGCFVGSWH